MSRFTLGWTWPDNWHNIGGYCILSPIIRLFVSSVELVCIYFLMDPSCQTVNETPLLSFYLLKNWQSHKAKSISPWLRFIFLERGEKFRRFVFLQYFGNLMINVLSWGEGGATAQLREYISSLWWPWLALFSNQNLDLKFPIKFTLNPIFNTKLGKNKPAKNTHMKKKNIHQWG